MESVAVIGAGTMGSGIAHVFAQFGFKVHLVELNDIQLAKALEGIKVNLQRQIKKELLLQEEVPNILYRIQQHTQFGEFLTSCSLIIEAASENFAVKQQIFTLLNPYILSTTLLATNTSSISITELAAVAKYPQNVVGMHFMNPVPVMTLVEVIKGELTAVSVVNKICSYSKALQKTPVVVNDYPGFIANRILMPMINEAIYALYEGVAERDAIDCIMQLGMAHPMGPLKLADFIGLDVCLSILKVLHQGFGNPKYAPCPLLVNKVNAGLLGKKTGKGFYDWN